MPDARSSMPLVKSKQRVSEHGEVFTPAWVVDEMLNLIKGESERIDARVLEPACGSGNFLIPVLARKLGSVRSRYRQSDFENRHYSLLAIMCLYGIELLPDNVNECRKRLLDEFSSHLEIASTDVWARAASRVLEVNIVQGDALTMTGADGLPIEFPEWAYLGRDKFQRRDFRYDNLAQRASFQGSLWDHLEEHEIFTASRTYPPMTAAEIAA